MSNGHQQHRKNKHSNLSPIILPRLPALKGIPNEIKDEFAALRVPNQIVEARKEYAYKFLEEVFLPLVKASKQITCDDLLSQMNTFKTQHSSKSNVNLDDFDLISSIDVKLEMLRFDTSIRADLRNLINESYDLLQQLIENCSDILFE